MVVTGGIEVILGGFWCRLVDIIIVGNVMFFWSTKKNQLDHRKSTNRHQNPPRITSIPPVTTINHIIPPQIIIKSPSFHLTSSQNHKVSTSKTPHGHQEEDSPGSNLLFS
jgi:hypothetical protein